MAAEDAKLAEQVKAVLPPRVGACVLAIDDGKVVFEHAYGLADVETRAACTPATNFRMASVSKQFTAMAVMLLADRGLLSLDDPITKFFPGAPDYWKDITVKHLLTHTSGLPHYEGHIPKGTTLQLNDVDVLHIAMDVEEPLFTPGSQWEYSNTGYTLLGLVVEVAAQKPFHDFMLSDVLKPLGMNDSVLYQRGLNTVPHRAFGHSRRGDDWVRTDQSVTSATRGDGAIYTSLRDYRKWLAGIDEQKLLNPESYAELFKPQVQTTRDGSHYGYGWFIDEYRGEPRIHHNGDSRGFRLCVQRFPERKAAVLVQINNNLDDRSEGMTAVGEKVADLLIFGERER